MRKLKRGLIITAILFNILLFLAIVVGVQYLDLYPILKQLAQINGGGRIDNAFNVGFVILNFILIIYSFVMTTNRIQSLIYKFKNIDKFNTWDILE